jgi:hypothetical protein
MLFKNLDLIIFSILFKYNQKKFFLFYFQTPLNKELFTKNWKMEESMSYEERVKERRRIISEINGGELEVKDLEKELEWKIKEIEDYKTKIKNHGKEIKDLEKEKTELEKKIETLKEKHLRIGIPVPEKEGYEIENGLLGVKRDINIKTTEYLNDKKIKQVFTFLFIFYFYFYFFGSVI